jgi:hypothetical protein
MEPRFNSTSCAATIVANNVAVVALFPNVNKPIAAHPEPRGMVLDLSRRC